MKAYIITSEEGNTITKHLTDNGSLLPYWSIDVKTIELISGGYAMPDNIINALKEKGFDTFLKELLNKPVKDLEYRNVLKSEIVSRPL